MLREKYRLFILRNSRLIMLEASNVERSNLIGIILTHNLIKIKIKRKNKFIYYL